MDEKKLRLIVAIVILAIGAAYMSWLVLTYLKTLRMDEYVRNSLEKWMSENVPPKTVPGDVEKESP